MTTKKIILGQLLLFVLSVQNTFAAASCTLNGESIPCDQMPRWPLAIFIVMGILFVPLMIFWIKMLIHVMRYQPEDKKIVWFLIVFFGQLVGAIVYYFAAKKDAEEKHQSGDMIMHANDDNMINQKLINYLQQHKDSYPKEALMQQLKSSGYTESDIQVAVAAVYVAPSIAPPIN